MGFNSAFKGLNLNLCIETFMHFVGYCVAERDNMKFNDCTNHRAKTM